MFYDDTNSVKILLVNKMWQLPFADVNQFFSFIFSFALSSGLSGKIRTEVQTEWMDGLIPVIAATISFGMGVDKASVRYAEVP